MDTTTRKKTGTSYAVPAADAMLDILEYLAAQEEFCGVTGISRTLGISNNLVFRIMKRLVARGYAENNPDGSYQLSTGFFSLGMKLYSRFELRRRARPHLEKLSRMLHTTCQLQVLKERNMLVMDVVTPDAPFFIQLIPGSRLDCHCNAFGKAVLAFKEPDEVKKLLPAKLAAHTEHTLTSCAALLKELDTVRKTGIAYDREEYNIGFFCIGAPVFDVNGEPVAGLGITGVSNLFPPKRHAECEQLVLECAAAVSREIGYRGTFFTSMSSKRDPLHTH